MTSNYMQRVGCSYCIRCDYKTDVNISFEAQDIAMRNHLDEVHPGWLLETNLDFQYLYANKDK